MFWSAWKKKILPSTKLWSAALPLTLRRHSKAISLREMVSQNCQTPIAKLSLWCTTGFILVQFQYHTMTSVWIEKCIWTGSTFYLSCGSSPICHLWRSYKMPQCALCLMQSGWLAQCLPKACNTCSKTQEREVDYDDTWSTRSYMGWRQPRLAQIVLKNSTRARLCLTLSRPCWPETSEVGGNCRHRCSSCETTSYDKKWCV